MWRKPERDKAMITEMRDAHFARRADDVAAHINFVSPTLPTGKLGVFAETVGSLSRVILMVIAPRSIGGSVNVFNPTKGEMK
jgi:hypothetical protein